MPKSIFLMKLMKIKLMLEEKGRAAKLILTWLKGSIQSDTHPLWYPTVATYH